jgi:hypothetical protein
MDRCRSAPHGRAARPAADNPVWADVPWWAIALIFAPVYLFSILVGYAFYLTPNSIFVMWPAGGVAVATLTLTRYRIWPILLLLIAGMLAGAEIVAISSLANVIEPLIGASLVRWFLGRRVDVSRTRDALGLVILAGIIAPAIAALPGATKFVGLESSLPRVGELVLLATLIVLVGVLVLGAPPKPFRSILDFPFVTFPLLIWATLWFDTRIVATASMLVASRICRSWWSAATPPARTPTCPPKCCLSQSRSRRRCFSLAFGRP